MAGKMPDEIVQFSAPMFFVEEDKIQALIDVMRIGRANDTCSVQVFTTPGSARCPEKFKEKIEQLCFGPGEVLKHVQIGIVDDDHFDTTLEFEVGLRNPENCILGQFLSVARVLIIDNDVFPANSVRKPINDMLATQDKDTSELSEMTISLLIEFLKFTFLRVPKCGWRTCCFFGLDQLHNIHYLIKLKIQVYLVDVVLNTGDYSSDQQLLFPGNRYFTALVLAVLWAAPNLILLVVDWLKASPLDTGRPCRVALQINLFRKYLNYTEESKCIVPVQDLTVAMNSDIPALVEDGYQFVFPIMQAGGKLLIIMYFMIESDPRTMLPLIIYPVAMFLFIRARQTQHVRLENELMEAEADSEGCIVSAVEAFEPTRDYRMRHMVTKKFTSMLEESRKANNKVRNFKFWNEQFVPWITIICVAVYMAFGAQLVLLGFETTGGYLAMIQIYNELGDRFQGIYSDLERGVQAGSPLVQLTKMLNLPTDIVQRMNRNHTRREYMTKELAKVQEDNPQMILCPPHLATDHLSFFDTIPIVMEDIGVRYLKALSAVHAHIHPEQIIFLTGQHGCGKTTLLRILTDIVTPCGGECLFSSHNRNLDVSNTPHLVPHCTLYENLTYGARWPDPARCRRIFRSIGLHKCPGLLSLLDEDIKNIELEASQSVAPNVGSQRPGEDVDSNNEEKPLLDSQNGSGADNSIRDKDNWQKQLSYSERKRIHMARGLMFNPEILAMHKPVDSLDARDIDSVLSSLKSFVTNRGVEEPFSTVIDRRPRTLFFSGGNNHNNERSHTIADQVWFMHGDNEQFHGIQVFTRDEYTDFIREHRAEIGLSPQQTFIDPPRPAPEPLPQAAPQMPQDLERQLEKSYAPFVEQIQETEKKFATAQAENRALLVEVARYKQESESREHTIQAMQAAERARNAVPPIQFIDGAPQAPAAWRHDPERDGTEGILHQKVSADSEDMPRQVLPRRAQRSAAKADGGFCSRSCT